jgi:hypothetical protein
MMNYDDINIIYKYSSIYIYNVYICSIYILYIYIVFILGTLAPCPLQDDKTVAYQPPLDDSYYATRKHQRTDFESSALEFCHDC